MKKPMSVPAETREVMWSIRSGTACVLRAAEASHGAESILLLGDAHKSGAPGEGLAHALRQAKQGLDYLIEADARWKRLVRDAKRKKRNVAPRGRST